MTDGAPPAAPQDAGPQDAAPGPAAPGPAATRALAGAERLAPLVAALLVLVAALPGLMRLPPLDRDESRFAQATAQMLETRDFVDIRFQDEPRDKKPVGIHWLQAAAVSLVSSPQARQIWAYRLPSLIGAMLAAAACAWGARAWLGRRGALVAGSVLGAGLILTTEAFIAKTDAVLCGAVTLSMAALGRLYAEAEGVEAPGDPPGRRRRLLFWLGQALAILVKGPIGPMVAGLALLALGLRDRRWRWMGRLGWGWGLLLVALVVGPWAIAITVSTDGGFWGKAVGGDLAPKLAGGHEGHGAPPGTHLLLSPVLLFPATALLPAALAWGWRRRHTPAARFALAWLVLPWLVFELMPTKLVHYTLPLYGALAWLAAAAWQAPAGRLVRGIGAAVSLLVGAALAGVALTAAGRYGAGLSPGSVTGAALELAAGIAGAVAAWRWGDLTALAAALILGVLGHAALAGGEAPGLARLWTSERAAALIKARGLDPRDGAVQGPVAAVGYAEPSLVFRLGTDTDLTEPEPAADDLANGEPVLVEARKEPAFQAAARARGLSPVKVDSLQGYDYSTGKAVTLSLYRDGAAQSRPAAPSRPPSP